ncbi:MAG: transpeptidase family protein [Deltaproteobacteria bacterium]|jgi:cell division protein FtsI (penicillin-binding protein 3)|nr:transpeptidase family protein [Deltaproteobacteria bacterium]
MILQQLRDREKNALYFILGCFVFCFACVAVQAARLQIIHKERLVGLSSQSTIRNFRLTAVRGDIYDRNHVKLATSVAVDSVFVDRRSLSDTSDTALQLWRGLNMDYEKIATWLENLKKSAYLKRHLTPQEAEAITSLKIKGVGLRKEYRRDYPNGTLAAHFLGFTDTDGRGLEGLEKALNEHLIVSSSSIKVRRDGKGRIIMDTPELIPEQPKGSAVVLTLDMRIQNIAEKAISKAVTERNAKSGMALVVRPKTGEILASAVYPTYDPNNFRDFDGDLYRNKVLTHPLEPGSTFKVFTVAAALQDRQITPSSVFFCERGLYQIDKTNYIRDTGSYGDLTVTQIVQKSSNIGAAKIGEGLGAARLHSYLRKFGFGQKTGLSFAGESPGLLRPPEKWVPVDLANIAFGQGVSVTALQLAMAVSALGNDGVLMAPMLVSQIEDAQGNVLERKKPVIVRSVVSPMVAWNITAMMREAVMKGGTGYRAEVDGYPISGKTGTAQLVANGEKRYSNEKYIASFVGLAPYKSAELCVLVILEEPWPSYYGGEVAAPVFKEIVSQALPILDVPKQDNDLMPAWPQADDSQEPIPGLKPPKAAPNQIWVELKKGRRDDGPLPAFPEAGARELVFDRPEPLVAKGVAPVVLGDSPGQMPDLEGLTMREVFELMAPYGLQVEYHGSGLAVRQEPMVGSSVAKGQTAKVTFGAPGAK